MAVNEAVTPVVNKLAGLKFDESAASVAQYAAAMGDLDMGQRRAAASILGLTESQLAEIVALIQLKNATKDMTVADLENLMGKAKGEIATKLKIASTDKLTDEIWEQVIATGALTDAEIKEAAVRGAPVAGNKKGRLLH